MSLSISASSLTLAKIRDFSCWWQVNAPGWYFYVGKGIDETSLFPLRSQLQETSSDEEVRSFALGKSGGSQAIFCLKKLTR